MQEHFPNSIHADAPFKEAEEEAVTVLPGVQSVRLRVRTARAAVPERAPGTDWRGLLVSQVAQFSW